MTYFICLMNEMNMELVPLKFDESGRFGTCDAQTMSTYPSLEAAKIEMPTILAHLRAMTAGQLLDALGFYKMEVHIRSTETLDYENLRDSEVEGAYTIYPVEFRNGILTNIYSAKQGLTVTELKRIVREWPEFDNEGLPSQVWIGQEQVGLSNIATSVSSLNARGWAADILISF